jgi:perosamine synthetase
VAQELPISPHPTLGWNFPGPVRNATRWHQIAGQAEIRYTYSGRAGIYQYLQFLKQHQLLTPEDGYVLVPAFHCPTVVDPVLHAGFRVCFYRVGRDLRTDSGDFLSKLPGASVALFIRYFGFADDYSALYEECRRSGKRIIEDCCHSFLEDSPLRLADSGADATIYSFWKLVPSEIGGGVLLPSESKEASLEWPAQRALPLNAVYKLARRLSGNLLDDIRIKTAGARNQPATTMPIPPVPAVSRSAEQAYPYDRDAATWPLPALARLVLSAVDLRGLSGTRRQNYQTLLDGLANDGNLSPVRSVLNPRDCPWGFPVLLQNRRAIDFLLRARGVPLYTFGEVLHPLLYAQHLGESGMLEVANELRDNLLVLSIHQQISSRNMARIAETANQFFRSAEADERGVRR